MILRIRATPNAHKHELVGWDDDPLAGRVLRVRIAAPATEGKANAALREFLAKSLGIAKSNILLQKGETSRIKSFEIPDHISLAPLDR